MLSFSDIQVYGVVKVNKILLQNAQASSNSAIDLPENAIDSDDTNAFHTDPASDGEGWWSSDFKDGPYTVTNFRTINTVHDGTSGTTVEVDSQNCGTMPQYDSSDQNVSAQ